MTEQEALEAAKKLKQYCLQQCECECCQFWDGGCVLNAVPAEYKIVEEQSEDG